MQKVAVVTGGANGIGKCIAEEFRKQGVRVYVSDATGDLQKIDVGIALSHFVMGLEEQGKKPGVMVADPGIRTPDGVEYIATVQ